jgi:ABC-2 type transport system permease protein
VTAAVNVQHGARRPHRARRARWRLVMVVASTDLRQLAQAKDFWVPMVALGAIFFVVIPFTLLLTITAIGDVAAVQQVSQAIEFLPPPPAVAAEELTATARTGYALSVYLFAPIAIVVPLTIATAVGAASIVGERERGTGEFLAHSPAAVSEIYLGKLVASLVPGYATTIVGFGVYSLLVNTIVGPDVGGWFFPTRQWWILVLWVLPPFLAIGLSLVLRLSARVRSTAAAQQSAGLVSLPMIGLAYGQAANTMDGAATTGLVLGGVAWAVAAVSLWRGVASVRRSRLLGVADEG